MHGNGATYLDIDTDVQTGERHVIEVQMSPSKFLRDNLTLHVRLATSLLFLERMWVHESRLPL
jgi:hypothetical protein